MPLPRAVAKGLGFVAMVVVFGMIALFLNNWVRNRHPTYPGPNGSLRVSLPQGTHRYVAIGDSYSAGEGVTPYEPGAGTPPEGDDCHRSLLAYPRLLDFADDVQVTFRACSGARLADIFDKVQTTSNGRSNVFGRQLESGVLDREVGLVTLSIGGNDANFSAVVQRCARTTRCLDKPYTDRDGISFDSLSAWSDDFVATFPARVEPVFERIRDEAPNARVVMLGYPHLFPTSRATEIDCDLLLRAGFDESEQAGLNTLLDRLNGSINAVAYRTGIEFIDPSLAWYGHEPCGAFGQWTNSVPIDVGARRLDRGAFHPNTTGQRQFARLVACYLRQTSERPESGTTIDVPAVPAITLPGGDVLLPSREATSLDLETGYVPPAVGSWLNPLRCDGG